MKPAGEPDAANPHVRFDERAMETEQGLDTEAPPTERGGNGYARPKPPRHPLDSTINRNQHGGGKVEPAPQRTLSQPQDFSPRSVVRLIASDAKSTRSLKACGC